MIRAILFDMGGTLDGDGQHWLDRFARMYDEAGLTLPWETVRAAFDDAERRSAVGDVMGVSHLDEMVGFHVEWQLEHLYRTGSITELQCRDLKGWIVPRFVAPIRAAGVANVPLLADLRSQGFQLGVVSNARGNVNLLCDDLGYSPYLSLVVDSHRVGIEKPDPAIYRLAADRLGLPPSAIMMVGDSFERDVIPAKGIGMTTAWLRGANARACSDPAAADIVLERLADLRTVIDVRSRTVA